MTGHVAIHEGREASIMGMLTHKEFLESFKEEFVLECVLKVAALQYNRAVHRAQLLPVPELLSTELGHSILHSICFHSLEVLPSSFIERNDETDISELGMEELDEAQHKLVHGVGFTEPFEGGRRARPKVSLSSQLGSLHQVPTSRR